ncbi:hypothetical protein SprV_0602064200 [Sparganum proliferum]
MRLNSRVRITGLSKAKIYSGQATEAVVYCYVPGQSAVLSESEIALNCRAEVLKEGRRVCARWPHDLLPRVLLAVTACHADFFLARALDNRTPSFIVCVPSERLAVGDQVEMLNVWRAGPSRVDYMGELLVPTILSTILRRNGSSGADNDLSRNVLLELPMLHKQLWSFSWRDRAWFIDLQLLLRELSRMKDCEAATAVAMAVARTLYKQTDEGANEGPFRRMQYAEEFVHFTGQRANEHDRVELASHRVLLPDDFSAPGTPGHPHLPPDWRETCLWPLDVSERGDEAKRDGELDQPTTAIHLLEPVGAWPTDKFVLLGRLGWHPKHNVFTLTRLGDESGDALPLFFDSAAVDSVGEDEDWCPGRSLVICTGPRLVTAKGAQPVYLFGQKCRMAFFERFLTIQRLCVLPKATTTHTIPETSSKLVEDSQILSEHLTIFVRHVGEAASPTVFTLKYDLVTSVQESNSATSLGSITLYGTVARRAYCSGIFQVGSTLLLELPGTPDEGVIATKPTRLVSVARVAQPFERRLSTCRHLVDLFRCKVLSITEASWLLCSLSDSSCYLSPSGDHFRISLQGLVARSLMRPDIDSLFKGSIWLVDPLPSTPSPPQLRVDFFSDSGLSDLCRLPALSRVCLFKARAYWSHSDCSWRLVVPLRPNRFQVDAIPSFIASTCEGLPFESTMLQQAEEEEQVRADPCPLCSVKVLATQQASECRSIHGFDAPSSPSASPSTFSLLAFCKSDSSEDAKFYFVNMLKCLELRIAFSKGLASSNPIASVLLKCLVSDGSAAGIISFDTADFCPKQPDTGAANAFSTFYPDSMAISTSRRQSLLPYREQLDRLSLLLGLNPTMTLDLLQSVMRLGYMVWTWQPASKETAGLQHAPDEENALGQALTSWFTSPGFLRPLQLALVHSCPMGRRQAPWRLRKTKLGTASNSGTGEVYLVVPPYPLLRVV